MCVMFHNQLARNLYVYLTHYYPAFSRCETVGGPFLPKSYYKLDGTKITKDAGNNLKCFLLRAQCVLQQHLGLTGQKVGLLAGGGRTTSQVEGWRDPPTLTVGDITRTSIWIWLCVHKERFVLNVLTCPIVLKGGFIVGDFGCFERDDTV